MKKVNIKNNHIWIDFSKYLYISIVNPFKTMNNKEIYYSTYKKYK